MAMYLIAESTASGSSGTFDFQNIPQTYKHLELRIVCRSASGTSGINMPAQFNGDTGANYSGHYVAGNGASTFGSNFPGQNVTSFNYGWAAGNNDAANMFGASIALIPDYTSTSKRKTVKTLNVNPAATLIGVWGGVWQSTAAINRVVFSCGTIAANSTACLYGIADNPIATGA
jgi:hypothetical protein